MWTPISKLVSPEIPLINFYGKIPEFGKRNFDASSVQSTRPGGAIEGSGNSEILNFLLDAWLTDIMWASGYAFLYFITLLSPYHPPEYLSAIFDLEILNLQPWRFKLNSCVVSVYITYMTVCHSGARDFRNFSLYLNLFLLKVAKKCACVLLEVN